MTEKISDQSDSNLVAAMVMPGSDLFALGLGWLLSLNGFIFCVFCLLGVGTGFTEIKRSVYNDPIEINVSNTETVGTGYNVKYFGKINGAISVVGKRKYTSEPFTLTAINESNNIIIYTPSLLPDNALNNPVSRWYEGEITHLDHGTGKINGNTIPVKSLFRDISVDVPDNALVIADSIVPTFKWYYVVILSLCALGLLYIFFRLLRSVIFVINRKAAARYIFRNIK